MKCCAGDRYWACNPIISLQNRAVGLKVLVCAMAMGILLASSAYPQYLDAVIRLPDTLGPLNGPYHMAWDENPAHPRLYIGGEDDSGGVIVAQAITCKRLARVSTGPVKALCFVPPQGKLYVVGLGTDSVAVVDCATNQITSTIHTASIVSVMQYNSRNDRLYCGGSSVTVVDCAADTVVRTIAVAASAFAYDSAADKLYAADSSGPLAVIDCASDSVVATLPEVGSAMALCLNPTARKVYAVTTDTLFAIRTDGYSVVARIPFDSLKPLLACDPQRNRVYCTYHKNDWGHWSSIDCSADTIIQTCLTPYPLTFLACNSARDMLYAFFRTACDEVVVYDATTGQPVTNIMLDGVPPGGGWSSTLDRLYCLPLGDGTGYSCCLLSAVDGTGDSIAGVVPLTVRAEHLVLDTVHNRLYFTYGSSACGCVGVVDCAQNVVTSYVYGGASPYAICYNPNNNRLYWRTGTSMTVYDCSTNTKIKKVNASGDVRAMRLNLGLNKLYVFSYDSQSQPVIDVVDCERDSVIGTVDIPAEGSHYELLLVPEDNTLWHLSTRSVVVLDCMGDTIVAAVHDTLGTIDDACACPEGRRVYAAGVTAALRAANMDKPNEIDTLHEWINGGAGMRFVNVPAAHKAYWVVNYSPSSAHLFVINTRTCTLADSLWLNRGIAGMCLDHTGNYVYCAPTASMDSTVIVIDARVDSVVARFDLPPMIVAEKNPLVPNRATNRIYVAQSDVYICGNEIPVIRDSMLLGVEELVTPGSTGCINPTIVRRGSPMRVSVTSELWDASGRRAAVLKAGLNDIERLAPGVYFVREGPQVSSRKPQAVRKVIIAE